jgi:hypothetical protein
MPLVVQDWTLTFQTENPEWEYILWTNDSLGELYGETLQRYDVNPQLHPAFICDVFRLEILRRYGGFYFDCDCICNKSLDELYDKISETKFAACVRRDAFVDNFAFGSVKNGKLLVTLLAETKAGRANRKFHPIKSGVYTFSLVVQRDIPDYGILFSNNEFADAGVADSNTIITHRSMRSWKP